MSEEKYDKVVCTKVDDYPVTTCFKKFNTKFLKDIIKMFTAHKTEINKKTLRLIKTKGK